MEQGYNIIYVKVYDFSKNIKLLRMTWKFICRPSIACSTIPVNFKEIYQVEIKQHKFKDFIIKNLDLFRDLSKSTARNKNRVKTQWCVKCKHSEYQKIMLHIIATSLSHIFIMPHQWQMICLHGNNTAPKISNTLINYVSIYSLCTACKD